MAMCQLQSLHEIHLQESSELDMEPLIVHHGEIRSQVLSLFSGLHTCLFSMHVICGAGMNHHWFGAAGLLAQALHVPT